MARPQSVAHQKFPHSINPQQTRRKQHADSDRLRLTLTDEDLVDVEQDVTALHDHPLHGQVLAQVLSLAHLRQGSTWRVSEGKVGLGRGWAGFDIDIDGRAATVAALLSVAGVVVASSSLALRPARHLGCTRALSRTGASSEDARDGGLVRARPAAG